VKHTKINLKVEKTEAGWQETLDSFWRKVTPEWFQWLGWVIMIGGLNFLAKETRNISLQIISGVSYVALFFYLQSIFFSLEFHGFPFIKSEQIRRVVSLIVSGILSVTLFLLLTSLVSEI